MERIVDIIESIAHEKGLDINEVKNTVTVALVKTAKKIYGSQYEYDAEIDPATKALKLYQKVLVVTPEDERLQEGNENFIAIKDAKEVDPEIEIGDELTYELPLDNLGRTAAATLQKELEYHIQRLLENNIFEKYQKLVGKTVFGTVVRVDNDENTYIEIDEIRAVLPRKNRIKGEKFKVGNVVKSVIRKVLIDKSQGMYVELSRTSPKFLESLLELEVPEIKDGMIKIVGSARIPGERAKIALLSLHPNIDAVGATVGTKGVRINAVSKELHNENIDCIEFSNVPEIFIARTLAPAIISNVKLQNGKAIVTLPSDQKSKAIGKNGINIRLTSMLCGVEVELHESSSTAASALPSGESAPEQAERNPDALKKLFGGL
ncbi:MAG: transcription termination/antitermination protein NusA [Epsilonproteobacteria bacterium]|uniref:transcription termination factor NusA n=1 Tax=Sulfurospirillum cavolei TaxID=366522 RepID=UPI0005AB25C5|nr:transcription termination factor NusA [Sulfurospirillum cavolei]MDY0265388.1 transcription termination factor NusA [Sulfurospirillum cavolei]NCB53761.1 transcription termination/antitermination protein NusA [Campylobacterota bacterium]